MTKASVNKATPTAGTRLPCPVAAPDPRRHGQGDFPATQTRVAPQATQSRELASVPGRDEDSEQEGGEPDPAEEGARQQRAEKPFTEVFGGPAQQTRLQRAGHPETEACPGEASFGGPSHGHASCGSRTAASRTAGSQRVEAQPGGRCAGRVPSSCYRTLPRDTSAGAPERACCPPQTSRAARQGSQVQSPGVRTVTGRGASMWVAPSVP